MQNPTERYLRQLNSEEFINDKIPQMCSYWEHELRTVTRFAILLEGKPGRGGIDVD